MRQLTALLRGSKEEPECTHPELEPYWYTPEAINNRNRVTAFTCLRCGRIIRGEDAKRLQESRAKEGAPILG